MTFGLDLTIDLDRSAVGVELTRTAIPLKGLLADLPARIQGILAWLPDVSITEAGAVMGLGGGTFGSSFEVVDAGGNPLTSSFVFLDPTSGSLDAAAGVFVEQPIGFGAVPLLGALLSAVSINELGATYATRAFAANEVVLPPDAPLLTGPISSGFALSLAIKAAGTSIPVSLPSSAASDSVSTAASTAATRMADPGSSIQWFNVNRSIGPLTVSRIGAGASDGNLELALDAGLDLSAVRVTLTGFLIGFSPSRSASPTISLDGLGISVSAGELQLSGSLVRTTLAGTVEYDGSVLIRIGGFAIDATGSYALIQGSPSLFVYGMAEGSFGGPPAFFVTGLAAGFGLNRALRLPDADHVQDFPMIAAAQGSGPGSTADALGQLSTGGWVPPQIGADWFAAGVEFTSFELVEGFAVLTAQLGADPTFALLGDAWLALPEPADKFAYAEVTIEAVLAPRQGEFKLVAELTPRSFLIDPDCKLTGGLALALWFGSSPHAGDFVLTIGGYHPMFTRPDWYPNVSRLGFAWHVSDALQITGESYFALTPSCVMGGGKLSALFAAGPVKAWFDAYADFLMSWRPFWFEGDVGVSVGLSLTVDLGFVSGTVSIQVGVSVELWGPPLRGIAHVSCWVTSFDIPINGGGTPPEHATTLDSWSTFAQGSLPASPSSSASAVPAAPMSIATAVSASAPICRARPSAGLRQIIDSATGEKIWLFGGDGVSITTESAIPSTELQIAGPTAGISLPGSPINVYPLGNVSVTSTHAVLIAAWSGADWQPGQPLPTPLDVTAWTWTSVSGQVPAALWGPRGEEATPPAASKLVQGVVGVTGVASGTSVTGGIVVHADALLVDQLPPRPLPVTVGAADEHGPPAPADSRSEIASALADAAVSALRTAVVAELQSSGMADGLTASALTALRAELTAAYTTPPMIGPLGTTGPPQVASPAASTVASTSGPTEGARAAATPPGAELRAVFTQITPRSRPRSAYRTAPPAPAVAALISDRRSSRVELSALRGIGARVAQEPALLWPGWTAVWDFASDAQTTLEADLSGPLWLVALDHAQMVLATATLTGRSAAWQAPAGVRRVAVSALVDATPTMPLGWNETTRLRQLGSQTFIDAGIIVRRQSLSSSGLAGANRALAVVSGQEMIMANRTVDTAGTVRSGYVDTHFPCTHRGIVVGLAREPDGGEEHPREPAVVLHGHRDAHSRSRLRPASAEFPRRSCARWTYRVRSDTHCVVRVDPPPGWRLEGVFALAEDGAGWPDEQRLAHLTPTAEQPGSVGQPAAPSRAWWELKS